MKTLEENAHFLIATLVRAGFEARLVGGCVRDRLLGLPMKDNDLATPATPDEVTRVLEGVGLKVVPTGLAHGTVTVVVEGRGYEITTLRRDIKTDGRHAEVVFTQSWEEDAQRRDFTINALSQDVEGKVYDYVGGLADVRARRLRFVGDATARIREDYLRVLRYFRFLATLGEFYGDDETLQACATVTPFLKSLSRERVGQEFRKILNAPKPSAVWQSMAACGVVGALLPEAENLSTLCRMEDAEAVLGKGVGDTVMRRLAALVMGKNVTADSLQERLALTNVEGKKLVAFLGNPFSERGLSDEKTLAASLYHQGIEKTRDFLLLAHAAGAHFGLDSARTMLEKWQPKTFPVKGEDLLALGVPSGPLLGDLLCRVEEAWIAKSFLPDKEACLALARTLLGEKAE